MKRTVLLLLVLLLALPSMAMATEATEPMALPLVDEPVTMTLWLVSNDTVSQYLDNYEEHPFFVEMEKRTGIHMDIELVSNTNAAEAFNLLIASGELPDIIVQSVSQGYFYTDGLDAAVDDGYFLDLTPYLDNLAADYQAARTWDIETEKQTITDEGRVVGFWQCYTFGYQPPWDGMMVRGDWLEELGLEIPLTYDDWHEMLTAFKEEKGATAPMLLGPNGHIFAGTMSAGYGVGEIDLSSGFMQKDGTIFYNATQDGYKDYLTMMNQWYSEGLIDPDFLSATSNLMPNTSLVASGATGAFPGIYTLIPVYNGLAEGANFVPAPTPVKEEGDTIYVGLNISGTGAGNYTVISADTEYPELAVAWCNYLYTEAGTLLAGYGVEGETYTIDEAGNAAYTEFITESPEGYTFSEAMSMYTLFPSLGCNYDWTRETQVLSEDVLGCFDVWNSNYVEDRTKAYALPSGTSMTQEENTEFSTIMADISTYVKESTTKFITGELSLDSWDDYVATIEAGGIDRAAELYQAALDRYYSK